LVVHLVVDAEAEDEAGELIDHPDRGVAPERVGAGVLVLAHLAAGVDDRMSDAARVAGAGVDDYEGVTEPAAMRACQVRHLVSFSERDAPDARCRTHRCPLELVTVSGFEEIED
jgi:hypothetical protein